MSELELSIVMPCLDEAATLPACLEKAQRFLTEQEVAGEVIVADNGSSDGSQQIARARGARLLDVPTRGYGAALIAGICAARGRYVVMADSDDTYDFYRLDAFLEKLREGYPLVMGNRFSGGIAPGAMPLLHHYLGNPVISWIGRRLHPVRVRDLYCGLRGFDRERMLTIGPRSTGMTFALEMVVNTARAGLSIAEVPTTLSRSARAHPPHLNTWRDGWRSLVYLVGAALPPKDSVAGMPCADTGNLD
jgi:glycosyltransferase involved in cell wall biosynthesis